MGSRVFGVKSKVYVGEICFFWGLRAEALGLYNVELRGQGLLMREKVQILGGLVFQAERGREGRGGLVCRVWLFGVSMSIHICVSAEIWDPLIVSAAHGRAREGETNSSLVVVCCCRIVGGMFLTCRTPVSRKAASA